MKMNMEKETQSDECTCCKKFSLIVPMMSESFLPKELVETNGCMACLEAIELMPLADFSDIYFVYMRKDEERRCVSSRIKAAFAYHYHDEIPLERLHFIIFDEMTANQPETVYNAIKTANITGPIFIKDADNKCAFDVALTPTNQVCVYNLEECDVVMPTHKSYVAVDDNMYITNIIENRVVSNLFNCGGYCFEDASLFAQAYDEVSIQYVGDEHLYMSNIVYYLIFFYNKVFRPIICSRYDDFVLSKYCKNLLRY